MKKLLIVTCAIILIAAAVFVSHLFSQAAAEKRIMQKLGSDLMEIISQEKITIIREGKTIIVSQEATDLTIDNWQGDPVSTEEIINRSIRKQANKLLAKQSGITVSDVEVNEYIEGLKAGIKESVNKEDFYDFLDGLNLSVDEFYSMGFESYRSDLIAKAFWEKQRDENPLLQNDEQAWKEFMSKKIDEYIEADDIKIVNITIEKEKLKKN